MPGTDRGEEYDRGGVNSASIGSIMSVQPVLLCEAAMMNSRREKYRYAMSAALGLACVLSAGVRAVADHQNSPHRTLSLRFFAAIRKGDAASVKRMLDRGVSAHSHEIMLTRPRAETHTEGGKEYPGSSAIMIACESGNVAILGLLVKHGAPVNPPTTSGSSPIMAAVEGRSTDAVRYLLDHGARANQIGDYGEPVIVYAISRDDTATVKLLLDRGADINAGKEKTLLMEAVSYSSPDVVKLLLERGADPNLRRNGTTALEIAEQGYDDKIVDALRAVGARGHTKIQLQRIEDRRKRTTLPENAASQVHTAATKPVTRRAEAEDYAVIAAMVRDMLTSKNEESPFYRGSGGKIVVNDTTRYQTGYWDEQIEPNLSDDQANEITLAMRENMLSRNRQPALFDHNEFRENGVVAMTDANVHKTFDLSGSSSNSYRGWIACYLPGYSRKRDAAVVPFSFGPTSHGSSGVCFLVRANGTWRVKWVSYVSYA